MTTISFYWFFLKKREIIVYLYDLQKYEFKERMKSRISIKLINKIKL